MEDAPTTASFDWPSELERIQNLTPDDDYGIVALQHYNLVTDAERRLATRVAYGALKSRKEQLKEELERVQDQMDNLDAYNAEWEEIRNLPPAEERRARGSTTGRRTGRRAAPARGPDSTRQGRPPLSEKAKGKRRDAGPSN